MTWNYQKQRTSHLHMGNFEFCGMGDADGAADGMRGILLLMTNPLIDPGGTGEIQETGWNRVIGNMVRLTIGYGTHCVAVLLT